jgi:exosome complex component RRP45
MSVAQPEPPLSSNSDVSLLLRLLGAGQRADGRGLLDARAASFSFDRADGRASAECALGATRVHAAVTADVAAPFADRPLEGSLSFFVELLPSSSGAADFPVGGARAPLASTTVARLLERQVRDARAIDTEALCVVPGVAVWALRVDVRVEEDGGNVGDAAAAAAMAALLHFRLSEVTVAGRAVTVHAHRERVPRPLAVHHTPVTVTLGIVSAGAAAAPDARRPEPTLLVDPSLEEEVLCDGTITVCVNAHSEVCGLHKSGAAAVSLGSLAAAAKAAGAAAAELVAELRRALERAEVAAIERERERHAKAQGYALAAAVR